MVLKGAWEYGTKGPWYHGTKGPGEQVPHDFSMVLKGPGSMQGTMGPRDHGTKGPGFFHGT
eukprot:7150127-Karenia_brevis.AAC.1